MKLSIIVPVYNVEEYLPRCLDPLAEQSLGDYELILIDDGSTDGSGRICDEYARRYPGLVRVRHIDNGGQGRARNIGIELARGEYLGFVDSDDWVDLSMYEKLCRRAEETGADVAVCDFLAKYEDGREEYLPACVQAHRLASAGSACNKVFHRDTVGDIRFPEGLWYEDFYFSARLLLASRRTEFIPEPLYFYRQAPDSTMRNQNSARNLDMLAILDMLEPFMEPEEFRFFVINHVVLDSISRLACQSAPDRKAVIAKMRAYAHEKIPRLSACQSYKRESARRRLIMGLNYMGLEDLAQIILKIKSAV